MKKLLKREGVQRALAWLIHAYSATVFRLTRWTRINDAAMVAQAEAGQPFIVAFWHGRMILLPNFWRFRLPLHMLGSPHRDGRLMLRVMDHFGIHSIVGSSSKGGARALRMMARMIATGNAVSLTPDGPRGPRMRIQMGAIVLAQLTGAPIYPVTCSIERARILGSWDRLMFPFPFGRGAFVVGDPVRVPRDADSATLEAARLALEARLNAATAEADRRCGHVPVEPAPVSTPDTVARVA